MSMCQNVFTNKLAFARQWPVVRCSLVTYSTFSGMYCVAIYLVFSIKELASRKNLPQSFRKGRPSHSFVNSFKVIAAPYTLVFMAAQVYVPIDNALLIDAPPAQPPPVL